MSGIYEIMHDPEYWKDPEVFRPGEINFPFFQKGSWGRGVRNSVRNNAKGKEEVKQSIT